MKKEYIKYLLAVAFIAPLSSALRVSAYGEDKEPRFFPRMKADSPKKPGGFSGRGAPKLTPEQRKEALDNSQKLIKPLRESSDHLDKEIDELETTRKALEKEYQNAIEEKYKAQDSLHAESRKLDMEEDKERVRAILKDPDPARKLLKKRKALDEQQERIQMKNKALSEEVEELEEILESLSIQHQKLVDILGGDKGAAPRGDGGLL